MKRECEREEERECERDKMSREAGHHLLIDYMHA